MSLLMRRRRHGFGSGGSPYDTRDINLVLEGDSITRGGALPIGTAYGETALADAALSGWPITLAGNLAGDGNTMTNVAARAATADALLSSGKRNVLSLLIGTNDIVGGGTAPATVVASIKSYCQARQAAGWYVIVCTDLSRGVSADPSLRTFNSLLAADTSFYSALVDFGADPRIGPVLQAPTASENTTYIADTVHPTAAGRSVMVPIWISGFRVAAGRATPAVASITVSATVATGGVGGTQAFTAKSFDSFGVPVPNGTIVWSSSDPSIATINSSTGALTGVSTGTVTVTATIGSVSGNTSYEVRSFVNPGDIATQHIWVRAHLEPYANNATAQAAFDHSGHKYHALGTVLKYKTTVINGKNAYYFDSNGRAVFGDVLSGLTQGELFWVGTYTGFFTAQFGSHATQGEFWRGAGNTLGSTFGSALARRGAACSIAADTPFIVNVISTPTEFTINVNNVQLFTSGTNTVGWTTTPKVGIGNDNLGGTGLMGDLFISTAKLSDEDRTLVLNEMATFYGITI